MKFRVHEKWGGRPFNIRKALPFLSRLHDCSLIDLGFLGKDLIFQRLDKAFANENWLNFYPSCVVNNLPRIHSDHHPLLLNLTRKVGHELKLKNLNLNPCGWDLLLSFFLSCPGFVTGLRIRTHAFRPFCPF